MEKNIKLIIGIIVIAALLIASFFIGQASVTGQWWGGEVAVRGPFSGKKTIDNNTNFDYNIDWNTAVRGPFSGKETIDNNTEIIDNNTNFDYNID